MTATSRLTLLPRIAVLLGGYAGDITSGTATTIVADGLVGAVTDDALNDDLLVMPSAATSADTVRIITDTTGATGTLTWSGNRADTTYTSEPYFTIPKGTFTLQELRQAISRALLGTRRSYAYVLPAWDGAHRFPLPRLTWLRHAEDVDAVYLRPSPGLLHNEDFGFWDAGTAAAPDGWTLAGSGATVARQTTFASVGAYEAAVTRATNDATLTQDIPYPLAKQLIDGLATVALRVRCTAAAASRVRVGIDDGNDVTWSDYHSGGGEPEDLSTARTLTAAASRVRAVCSVDGGDTTGSFDLAGLVEDSAVPDAFMQQGSAGYREHDIAYDIWNVGNGVPELVVFSEPTRKAQFLIVSRRPYADLTTDAATTEAPADLITAKAIYELALLEKPALNHDRADLLLKRYGTSFAALAKGIVDKPAKRAAEAVYVRGA